MHPKTVIQRIFEALAGEIGHLSEADLLKLEEGTHELTLKIIKKRSVPKITKELSDSQKENTLKRLQECQLREDGLAVLSETFKNKKELEQFAKFLEVMVLKRDKVDQIRRKIIEATVGAVLRSNAIQGEKHDTSETATINSHENVE